MARHLPEFPEHHTECPNCGSTDTDAVIRAINTPRGIRWADVVRCNSCNEMLSLSVEKRGGDDE